MRCPFCDNFGSKVTDSRTSLSGVRRRRECMRCGLRFTTYEKVHVMVPMVVKIDQRREPYDAAKLARGITLACAKRRIAAEQIGGVVADIEMQLFRMGQAEIESRVIGKIVIEELRRLDHVAYIRYASVYDHFDHAHSFADVAGEVNWHTVPTEQMELFANNRTESAKLNDDNRRTKSKVKREAS